MNRKPHRKGRKTGSGPPPQEAQQLIGLCRARRFAEAIEPARGFTRQWPKAAVGWHALAMSAEALGELDEAERAHRKALEIEPDNAEGHNNLGLLLTRAGRHEEAAKSYRRALRLRPRFPEAQFNLGLSLSATGLLEEASDCYRQVLKIRPDLAEAHVALGNLLMEAGRIDEAVISHRQAAELRPRDPVAQRYLGNVLAVLGRVEEAGQAFRAALNLASRDTESWHYLAQIKRFNVDDSDLVRLQELHESADLSTCQRMYLEFALGKALADIGADADQVFPHYRRGCQLKRATFDYDPGQVEQFFRRIAQCCPTDWFSIHENAGSSTEAPIFVVGMPRSGTSLVEQILSSHPRVHGAGERNEFEYLIALENESSSRGYPEWLPEMTTEEYAHLGASYQRRMVYPIDDVDRVVDKTLGNFQYLGLIAVALPKARIVHVQRNPLDTCLSCFMHLFNGWQPFSYELTELGRYYRAYAGLMDHWRKVLPDGHMLELEYEQLVADPEPRILDLLNFCGLEWDSACLEFHSNRRSVKTASTLQVRQPLYRHAVGRWQKYHSHLQPLIDALGPLATNGPRALL